MGKSTNRRQATPLVLLGVILAILICYTVLLLRLIGNQVNAVPHFERLKKPLTHWTLSVITFNRLASLQRLLASLESARYYSLVDLRINVEAGAPKELLQFVEDYSWVHGEKVVHVRVARAGLIAAVVESWYPAHDHDFGVLLEDDLEVSPYFQQWLLSALDSVRQSAMHNSIFGLSLYTPRVIETTNPYKIFLPDVEFPHTPAFLQQLPCSWGAMFFPQVWKKFVKYVNHRLTFNGSMLVPNSRSNGWETSWKRYFIEMAWAETLFMLYPNFKNQTSFSTNHVEQGAHVDFDDREHTRALYTVPLHTTPVHLKNDFLHRLPMLDASGNRYNQVEDDANVQLYCHEVSCGHTGIMFGDPIRNQLSVGNKLLSGFFLPPGFVLVSIPRNTSYFVGTMLDNGLFVVDRCTKGKEYQCLRVGQLGVESSLPNLVLSISNTGKVVISPYACVGVECKATWQSDGGRTCAGYVLHLQSDGLLALLCGCGCLWQKPVWSAGNGSYQPVRCSSRDGVQPVLRPHSRLSSKHLNTLLSDQGLDGQYIEAVMQADGNFVLYLNPSSSIHPVFSIPTNSQAQTFVFEIASDGNLRIIGHTAEQRYVLWDNGFHGVQFVPYFLMIAHCGALTVYEGYGACEYGRPVWTRSFNSACSFMPPRCLDPAAAQHQLLCGQVTADIYNFLTNQDSFTVLLSTFGENPGVLEESVVHVSQNSRVSSILVVNLNPFEPIHRPSFINGKLVKYLPAFTRSFKNKFFPSVHITTEAVLLLEEGILVHHDDLEGLYQAWVHKKYKLHGLFPRHIQTKTGARFPVMSTKATMLHKSHIYQYSCLLGPVIHDVVDQLHCEDVALNILALKASGGTSSNYIKPSNNIHASKPLQAGSLHGEGLADSEALCIQYIEDLLYISISL